MPPGGALTRALGRYSAGLLSTKALTGDKTFAGDTVSASGSGSGSFFGVDGVILLGPLYSVSNRLNVCFPPGRCVTREEERKSFSLAKK